MTRTVLSTTLLAVVLAASLSERPAFAQQPAAAPAPAATVRVVGTVAMSRTPSPCPVCPSSRGAEKTVYTDVDGRYMLDLAPGSHELKVAMDGYQERIVTVDVAAGARPTVDVALSMTGSAKGHGDGQSWTPPRRRRKHS